MAATTKSRIPSENGSGKAPADLADIQQVVIPRVEMDILRVEIVGKTPLIVCAWSFKARRQMLEKQMKRATRGREAKVPEDDYKNSRYISTAGWDGIPAGGMKGCLVNATRAVKGLPMTLAKRMIFVRPQGATPAGQGLVRVHGEHEMHEAMVRIDNGGTADIRFRAMFRQWSVSLEIEFLSSVISAEQVANLVELAGSVEGLCEHRPGAPKSNTGDNGRFELKRD